MSIAFALFLLFYLNSTAALLMPGFINMIILHDQERIKPLHISAPSLLSLNFSRVYPHNPPLFITICCLLDVISLINCNYTSRIVKGCYVTLHPLPHSVPPLPQREALHRRAVVLTYRKLRSLRCQTRLSPQLHLEEVGFAKERLQGTVKWSSCTISSDALLKLCCIAQFLVSRPQK